MFFPFWASLYSADQNSKLEIRIKCTHSQSRSLIYSCASADGTRYANSKIIIIHWPGRNFKILPEIIIRFMFGCRLHHGTTHTHYYEERANHCKNFSVHTRTRERTRALHRIETANFCRTKLNIFIFANYTPKTEMKS